MRRPAGHDVQELLRTLRAPTRGSALRATVDGAWVTLRLRRRGIRGLLPAGAGRGRADAALARTVSAAVDAGLGVLPVRPTCLRRSVTLLRELERLGVASTLHVGVRRGPRKMEAHAWVVADGVVVNDDPELIATYAELAAGDIEKITATLR